MADYEELVYASRATFPPTQAAGAVEREVARILLQSRLNNPRRGLVGALYYGDGCFFQCLQGPRPALESTFGAISRDPRHRDVTVLRRQPVATLSFSGWAMKYVPAASDVRALLVRQGLKRFDPYAFDAETLERMIALLQRQPGDTPRQSPAAAPAATSALRSNLVLILAVSAVVLASLAVVISLLR